MSHRRNTPKGGMSGGASLPAIMMMPPHIRATFMPNPPLKYLAPPKKKRVKAYIDPDEEEEEKGKKQQQQQEERQQHEPRPLKVKGGVTGVSTYMVQFERTPPPQRRTGPTPQSVKANRAKRRLMKNAERLKPLVEKYRSEQRDCIGEYDGMNCYNTLFVGRLAYEVTERKLLREFEIFGPIKDLRIVYTRDTADEDHDDGSDKKQSRGYAFIEYENEEDMKHAYRAADGMRVEGREVVVDVERGHTVPNWLPRRLGGGLGGTRLGGKDKNVTLPGRFDPSKPDILPRVPLGMGGPPMGPGGVPGMSGPGGVGVGGPGMHPPPHHRQMMGGPMGGGPPPPGGPGVGYRGRQPPPRGGAGGGPPPPGYWDRNGPPPGRGGGYGGPPPPRGGRYDDRDYGGRYGGGGGGGGSDRGRKRNRSRSRSPDRRDGRRGRY